MAKEVVSFPIIVQQEYQTTSNIDNEKQTTSHLLYGNHRGMQDREAEERKEATLWHKRKLFGFTV